MSNKELRLPELIAKVKGDEPGAFEELYERYFRLAYYIAYKACLNDADTKDIVQEVFLEVNRSINSLQNPDAFKFWLNRIILSKTRNLFRRNKYDLIDDEQISAKRTLVENRTYMLPERNALQLSDQEVLAELINTLPEGQREVLVLFYLEQFSIHEVAQLMKISEGTVKSRLSYARATLRKKVEHYERLNETQLSFHNIGEAIIASMVAEMASIQIPKSLVAFAILPNKKLSSLQSIVATSLGKIVLSAICIGGVSLGGAALIQNMNQENVIPPLKTSPETSITTEKPFPEMNVLGKNISTAKDAYFSIHYIACCEEEMKHLSSSEIQEIQAIYTTLKEVGSPYYQSLLDEGWLASFENISIIQEK